MLESINTILNRYRRKNLLYMPQHNFFQEQLIKAVKKHGFFTVNYFPNAINSNIGVSFHGFPERFDENEFLHNHSFFEMAYIYQGNCVNITQNSRLTLQQGDTLLMNPHYLHCIRTYKDSDIVVNIFISKELFSPAMRKDFNRNNEILSFFFNYLNQTDTAKDHIYFPYNTNYPVKELIEQITQEYYSNESCSESIIEALFLQLLSQLARSLDNHYRNGLSEEQTVKEITQIVNYIYENYKDITLEELSEHFSYSISHISRLIYKYTGVHYIDVVQGFKLERAKKLLETTNLSTSEIIEQIGLKDISYFYKLFRNKYHVSPIRYRKSLQSSV